MKKRIISVLLTAVFIFAALAGCSGYSRVKATASFGFNQDNDYVVRSNGGSAVQYGPYIYFVNGAAEFSEELNTKNEWGKIIKGGLYKAKLNGARDKTDTREFLAETDNGLDFVSEKGVDYTDEETEIDITTVQLIAPKVIGTTGYDNGGIFIYDGWIYYATPNNNKGRDGTVQTTRTDFMRSKLDGTKTQKIFTTEGDSADKPYAFYKFKDNVYLVCAFQNTGSDDTDAAKMTIASVKMTGDKQPGKKNVTFITRIATSVLLPSRDVYDSLNPAPIGPEDYVYYTRAVEKADSKFTGNVAELCLPDGGEGINFLMTGKDITLEAVSGGALFYRMNTPDLNLPAIYFDNLHDILYKTPAGGSAEDAAYSKTYTDYENSQPEHKKRSQCGGGGNNYLYSASDLVNYTTTYCFRDNYFTDIAYVLAFSDSAVRLFSNADSAKTILNEGVTLHAVANNEIYFTSGRAEANFLAGILYKTNYRKDISEKSVEEQKIQVSHTEIKSAEFKADYVAGYIMYFAYVDEWADGYAYFVNQRFEGSEKILVYERSEEDVKPDEDDE